MKIRLDNCLLMAKDRVTILIEDERISYIGVDRPHAEEVIDLNERVVIPGLIDPHVHVRDMGLAYKEDWTSASRAAAVGGITTIFDMPNTKPRTVDQGGLDAKRNAAQKSLVNWGIHFGATETNFTEIENANPIAGIKVFMAESSSDFCVQSEDALREIFRLAKQRNKPVLVHSEIQAIVSQNETKFEPTILNHNKIRSPEAAVQATRLILTLTKEIGNRLYIAHVSTAEEMNLIQQAKKEGLEVICEVTPHHLLLDETILEMVGNYGKVNPPLRSPADRDGVYRALLAGIVDHIGTDHAPHTLDEKNRTYAQAPSGFPGLETFLPLLLTEVYNGRLSLEKMVQLTSGNIAQILNLKDRGTIKTGNYADLIAIDFDKIWQIDPTQFYTKAKYSPYQGRQVVGKNDLTLVNGRIAYFENQIYDISGKEVEFNY